MVSFTRRAAALAVVLSATLGGAFFAFAGEHITPAQGSAGAATSVAAAAFPLLAPDGSTGAPSYSFSGLASLGFYRSGSTVFVSGGDLSLEGGNGFKTSATSTNFQNSAHDGTFIASGLVETRIGNTQVISVAAGSETVSGALDAVVSATIAPTLNSHGTRTGVSGTAVGDILQTTFQDGGTNSTTVAQGLVLKPTINYTGASKTGHYEALAIQVPETSNPSGTNYLMRASAGVAGTTDKFTVQNTGATAITNTVSTGTGCCLSATAASIAQGLSGSVAMFTGGTNQTVAVGMGVTGSGGIIGFGRSSDGAIAGAFGQAQNLAGGQSDTVVAGSGIRICSDGNASGSGEIGFYVAPALAVEFGNTRSTTTKKWTIQDVAGYPLVGQSGMVYGWAASTDAGAAYDTSISRNAAGVVQIGTSAANASGTLLVASATHTGTLTLTGATIAGTPTWSSSQAITLSTAAQGNVTSLGTLTSLTMGGQISFGAGLGAITQILGPSDQIFAYAAGAPAAGNNGRSLTFTASNGNDTAVIGKSGGSITFTAGSGSLSASSALTSNGAALALNGGSSTTSGSLSASGGAGLSGGTDKAAGGISLSTGLPTGAGTADFVIASGFALASGTTTQTAYDRVRISSKTKALSTTSNTNTVFCNMSNAVSDSAVGCTITGTIEVIDATGHHVGAIHFAVPFSCSNKNGTCSAGAVPVLGTSNGSINTDSTFTSLTTTFTAVVSGTNLTMGVTPTWAAGAPTVCRITYQVQSNGQTAISPQ